MLSVSPENKIELDELDIQLKNHHDIIQPTIEPAPTIVLSHGTADNTRLKVYFEIKAWISLWHHSLAVTDREVGGVLVGGYYSEAKNPGKYLIITSSLMARYAVEKKTAVTFTHDSWVDLNSQVDIKHPGKKILGWYHTHPGFGAFLSKADEFIQNSFFNLPNQVAVVIDPIKKEYKCFSLDHGVLNSSSDTYICVNNKKEEIVALLKLLYPEDTLDKSYSMFMKFANMKKCKMHTEKFAVAINDTRIAIISRELLVEFNE